MHGDNDTGDALDGVAGMHPAVDRLRHLLATAALLDLRATADGYWTHRAGAEAEGPARPPESGR